MSLDPRLPAKLIALRDSELEGQDWTLMGLGIAPGYSAALVAAEPVDIQIHAMDAQ